jgi:hypothetical protein
VNADDVLLFKHDVQTKRPWNNAQMFAALHIMHNYMKPTHSKII